MNSVSDGVLSAYIPLLEVLPNYQGKGIGQELGIKEIEDGIWVVSFLDYDLGYFDEKNSRIEPVDDPFKALQI